jgi:hypothetical protein
VGAKEAKGGIPPGCFSKSGEVVQDARVKLVLIFIYGKECGSDWECRGYAGDCFALDSLVGEFGGDLGRHEAG